MPNEDDSSRPGRLVGWLGANPEAAGSIGAAIVALISLGLGIFNTITTFDQNERVLELEERLFISDVKVLSEQGKSTATISVFPTDFSREEMLRELEVMGITVDFLPPRSVNSKQAIISGDVELWVTNQGARAATVISIKFEPIKIGPLNTILPAAILEALTNPDLTANPRPQFDVAFSDPTEDSGESLPVMIPAFSTEVFHIDFELKESVTFREVYRVLRGRFGGFELTNPTTVSLTPGLQLASGQFVTGEKTIEISVEPSNTQ